MYIKKPTPQKSAGVFHARVRPARLGVPSSPPDGCHSNSNTFRRSLGDTGYDYYYDSPSTNA